MAFDYNYKLQQPSLLIIAGNARSLVANRGDLIREILSRGFQVGAAVPKADYLSEVEDLGIEIYPFEMKRTMVNPFQDFRTMAALVLLMRKLRPSAVFSYTVKPVVYGSLAARIAGVQRIYAMITGLGHTYTSVSFRTRALRFLVTRLYRLGIGCCTKVFFQNPDDLKDFVDFGILKDSSKSVRTNGSGVDTNRFAKQPLPNGDPVFLFIGRLLTEKGIAEFVEAASLLRQRWPQARFVAVGPHDQSLPHSVRETDLHAWKQAGVVEFVGGVKDVCPWLAKCSVFVLPSYYREGTPRSVLEAMSVGRAIVTSDAPGCRETVLPGKNGFLVPPHKALSLAEAMERFLLNPSLIFEMAEASRTIAEEKYEVSKVNRVIMKAMGLE